MQKDFYTIKDIAAEFQLRERAVRSLIGSGKLKAAKVCNKWIVSAENLKKFVEESEKAD